MRPKTDREGNGPGSLRLLTYLAPGLPLELFAGVALHIGRALGLSAHLGLRACAHTLTCEKT